MKISFAGSLKRAGSVVCRSGGRFMQKGKASIIFEEPPCIYSAAAIVGQKEGEGPLGACFDQVEADPMFGQANWEAAESELQRRTALCNMEKSGISREKIRYLFGGDLLGQIVATSFGVSELEIPLFGLPWERL